MALFGTPCHPSSSIPAFISVLALAALFLSAEALVDPGRTWHAAALADDGDGDGDGGDSGDNGYDGDDDDDDNDRGASSRSRGAGSQNLPNLLNVFRPNRPVRRATGAARPAPRATRAPDEIIATGLDDDDVDDLVERGYTVLSRDDIDVLDETVVRFRIRGGISLDDARIEVVAADDDATADFNHYYRTNSSDSPARRACEGPGCPAREMIGWPLPVDGAGVCRAEVRIGLIDTDINPDHTAFKDGRLEVIGSPVEGERKSSRRHGTAVASILIGSAESRSPGLLPNATVIAVDAFYRSGGGDERSDVFTLVRAMDMVAGRDVAIINMSLSGPPNAVLERMVQSLNERGIVIVAAAGNRGPRAEPVYPAAYPGVIAVTAVDHRRRVYRRAGRGEHIDISGPGVDVWIAASIRGAKFATGTSYAVPFITAATALALQDPQTRTHDDVMAALARHAIDLGEPGRDNVFGHGLLQAADLCG